jgi:polysaccharide deacetylase 2 family uncharacterized protein YibQ
MIKTKSKRRRIAVFFAVIVVLGACLLLIKLPVQKKKLPPRKPKIIEEKPVRRPRDKIAVIIDDVGYPSMMIEEYKNFKGKLTFAVLPFLEDTKTYAKVLHEQGFEILIHIPMEPLSYPETDPGPQALLTGDTKYEIEYKLRKMMEGIPHAVGANNHMGSKATGDPQIMRWTMELLKEKEYFFIDSMTTGDSLAYELAQKSKLDSAIRDIFLDNEDNFSDINAQFEILKQIAKDRSIAIGIGHINRRNTIEVLKYQLPLLQKENIDLVFVSEAVRN